MGSHSSKQNKSENSPVVATRTFELSSRVRGFIHGRERNEEMKSLQANMESQGLQDSTRRYKINNPEQAESLQTMFDCIQALRNFDSFQTDAFCNVDEAIDCLYDTSSQTFRSTGSEADQFTTLADFIVDIEGAEILQRFAENCFIEYYEFIEKRMMDLTCFDWLGNALGTTRNPSFERLEKTLGTMQNFSDLHHGFCLACTKAGVIPMCLENIQRIDAESDNWEEGDEESEPICLIRTCVAILHNMSQRLRNRELFVDSEEILLYFAKVKVTRVAASSLLCLAYLVNEETNHLILAEENVLSFIIKVLDEASHSKDRRSSGYSAKELAEGLSHLAINDTNKKVLGHKGAVHVLMSMLKTSREPKEKASAARALWMLAFDGNNKEAIRQETGALRLLRQMKKSKDPDLQKAAAGVLWELEGKTARNLEKRGGTQNHVMISYQWDVQEVLIEVKNRLQASGYRVWMDLEQMEGSTLEAMAKAVENASVVLVCVSQRYKESPNCRSEAEYAYQLRKDIIPLMLQHRYKADGWLGMLLGTKLWFEFHSKQVVEENVEKLIKELGERGRDVDMADGTAEPVAQPVEAVPVGSPPSSPAVSGWTNEEVKQWLKEIGLERVCQEDISEMNGQTLIDLQQVRGECPDYFYRCLEQNLKLTNMFDMFKFRRELNTLLA